MHRSSASRALAALLVTTAAACSGDATAPVAGRDDWAEIVSALPAFAGDSTAPAAAVAVAGTPGDPRHCTFAAGRFTCPAVTTRDGLVHERSFAFFDAAGVAQERYDDQTTASINTRTLLRGTVRNDRGTTEMVRASDQTVSGLVGRETSRIFDVTAGGRSKTASVTSRGDSVHAQHGDRLVATRVVMPAVVPPPPGAPRVRTYPTSGTELREFSFSHSIASTPPASATGWRRETTTYDGTNVAKVTVEHPGGTMTCTRNLDTGRMSCPTSTGPMPPR